MRMNNVSKTWKHYHCVLLLLMLSLVNINALCQNNARLTLLKVDSIPTMKIMTNTQVVGNRFCITYEAPKRWGSQLMRTYFMDEGTMSLRFEHEYFRNPATSNGIDYPILFQDSIGDAFVMDCTYPLVYKLDLNKHTMQNTHKFVFSAKSKVPYAMALNVPFACSKSENEYYFVGRQPKMGIQAVYNSVSDSAATYVKEVAPLVYTKKYPAWTTNFGKQTFNKHTNVLAHGFYLYPAIQYINLKTGQSNIIKIAEPNWKRLKPIVADVWSENLMQIKDIASSESYVYALWWNKTQQSMAALRKQNKANCKLVVLDWNGKIKKTYTIKRYLTNVVTLEDGKLIGSDGKSFWLITLE